MKLAIAHLIAIGLLCLAPAHAQDDLLNPAAAPDTDLPEIPGIAEPLVPADDFPEIDQPELPPINANQAAQDPGGAAPFAPLEDQQREMEQAADGFIIKDAGLNDIFQFLARSAGRQYFHNQNIKGPEFLVTGHLDDGNPLQQMEELAFMYGLSLHTKGNTIYALTQAQLAQLPATEFHYQLRYLRPSDIEQIQELIKPMLSPATGIVNFEPKTNTIIIVDTAHRIEAARRLLHGIDKAKGQIIVETKILRVNSTVGKKQGVNWTSSLGEGVNLSAIRDLNSVFGLGGGGSAPNLVLSPAVLTGVLTALNDGGIANQVSNPTLITEDNEQATISIIDRIPIITSTTTPGTVGLPTVSEEVRYKIDESDKAITEDAENHREIGISIVVTPTLLPDGTIRMQMRPRSAQIAGEIVGVTGNRYPRVTESIVESLARVPDGHSLIVGGFYGERQASDKTKVPGLGDVPILNFFFKSKEASREQTSLVFIVTPKSYNLASSSATRLVSQSIQRKIELPCDHDWVDPYNPGPAHEPNLRRTVRGLQPEQAPYYPRTEEFQPVRDSNPARPRHNSVRRR